MTERFPDFLNPAIDSNGNALAGAKLEFFITGTSTPKDTYTSSAKTTPNANPVIANSGGRFPEIFMDTDAAYKVTLSDALDVEIWTKDPVYPILPPGTFPIIAVSSKSSNYTVIATDRGADILVDASSGPATVTLLPVVTAGSGFVLTVVKTDSSVNAVTVDGNLAETINGATTVSLSEQYDAIQIGTEATLWYIRSEKRLPTPQVSNADQIVTVNSAGTGFTTTTNFLPTAHLTGLTLSNNTTDATNDIDIAAGKCRDDADTANLVSAAAIGKQLDVSWSAGGTPGTPTGGLSSSLTLTNDTWYHVFLGLVATVEEVVFDTSVTGANAITDHSFTNLRRIGSVRRETAANRLFLQLGDEVLWDVQANDVSASNPGTTSVLRTLTVPTGVNVTAIINAASIMATVEALAVLITPPDITDTAASDTNFTFRHQSPGTGDDVSQSLEMRIRTNTSAQIRTDHNASSAGMELQIRTRGYVDRRGRDG